MPRIEPMVPLLETPLMRPPNLSVESEELGVEGPCEEPGGTQFHQKGKEPPCLQPPPVTAENTEPEYPPLNVRPRQPRLLGGFSL